MKLHYSQTNFAFFLPPIPFYYLMKLHYSQTPFGRRTHIALVLLPYEITLFSNGSAYTIADTVVLLPYEITLFSNIEFN